MGRAQEQRKKNQSVQKNPVATFPQGPPRNSNRKRGVAIDVGMGSGSGPYLRDSQGQGDTEDLAGRLEGSHPSTGTKKEI